jgi:hypothetical protein
MSEPVSYGDDELLALLAGTLDGDDPVPAVAQAHARAAFTWMGIDAELAELAFDSALAASTRSGVTDRHLSFASANFEIEVLVTGGGTGRIIGQLVPEGRATVELHGSAGVELTESDDDGRFGFEVAPSGPLRLLVRRDGDLVVSSWVALSVR